VHGRRPPRGLVLDMDSSVSPTHGEQEMSIWKGHYACTCYHPRQHEAFDCHAFKRNRQEECVQMPVKIARSTPRPSFGLRAAGSQPYLPSASRDAAKSLLSTLVSEFIRGMSAETIRSLTKT